jgi:hypothetical protein
VTLSATPAASGTPTTLVVGPDAAAREAAIAAALAHPGGLADPQPSGPTAIILEGLAPGTSALDTLPADLPAAPQLAPQLVRIAPGCLCCTGNLVLRVTLNRLLRQRPGRLFIGVARSEHLDQLRSWLQAEPYDQLLWLTPDLKA